MHEYVCVKALLCRARVSATLPLVEEGKLTSCYLTERAGLPRDVYRTTAEVLSKIVGLFSINYFRKKWFVLNKLLSQQQKIRSRACPPPPLAHC